MTEEVWVKGVLKDGMIWVGTSFGGEMFFPGEVEFILHRAIEGPCLDSAEDFTAERFPNLQDDYEEE